MEPLLHEPPQLKSDTAQEAESAPVLMGKAAKSNKETPTIHPPLQPELT